MCRVGFPRYGRRFGATVNFFRITGITDASDPYLNWSYGYDAAGNAIADGSGTFGYDGAGRLTSANAGGTSAGYAHNALGQRVRKTVNGTSTIFSYDESGHLLGEYQASGALIREYVWLGDIPVAVITGGPGTPPYVFWYLHTDHLNTPRSVENPTTGELVWRWDAAPFGETAPNEDPDGDLSLFSLPLRFPGQYADSETGLSYNHFRDYEPQTGRYVQSDPIGLNGGTNTYSYVASKPLMFTDPAGLKECRIVGTRRTKWEEIPGTRYTLGDYLTSALASNMTGIAVICIWKRVQSFQERRDVYFKIVCKECTPNECRLPFCRWVDQPDLKGLPESRWSKDRIPGRSSGIALQLTGGNYQSPSDFMCDNPWTGQTVTGGFRPGP